METAPAPTRKWVRFPRPGMPEWRRFWSVMQDLGPGPDHYYSLRQGCVEVARFNRDRHPWAQSDIDALHAVCRHLNEREFPDVAEPQAAYD